MQIVGTALNAAEVEAATKALRLTLRPNDALGHYSLAGNSGIMTGIGGGGTIFAFRWGSAAAAALIRRITFSWGNNGTAFVAWGLTFGVVRAYNYTAACTGGTTLTPSSAQNKRRASMPASLVSDVRISSTAVLTLGTRTMDIQGFSALDFGTGTVAGASPGPVRDLWRALPDEMPFVLLQNEGFELIMAGNANVTGTWKFAVKVDWTEITSYAIDRAS
jgi:hypothetical protein